MSLLKDKPLKKCHTDDRKMIDDIHNEIIKDLSGKDLTKYYLDNGLILNDYYLNKKEKSVNNEGILTFFDTEKEDKTKNTDIINNYMKNIDDRVMNETYKDYNYYNCTNCDNKMQINEMIGELICSKCGNTLNVLINTEKNSYNDPPKEVNYFSYKRINHFNEWLAQFQAKETTEIPNELYKQIDKEIKKNINLNPKDITRNQMREILKKLNYNKYYEHIPYLINIISEKESPKLDRKEEEILRSLFKDIQIPFVKHCPPERKNFLSYSYVLYKFCELLEYDNLLCNFSLLKSREKLQQQDKIWKCICEELNWEYIPSA